LRNTPDVLFVPAHVAPFFTPCRVARTIHDIASEHVASAYSFFERWYAHITLTRALKKKHILLVPSEQTEKDVFAFAQKYSITHPRIVCVPLGIDMPQSSPITPAALATSPYILCVGRVEKKKQTDAVVRIFSVWALAHPECAHRLVLAGKPGFGYAEVVSEIEKSSVRHRIDVLGWVDDTVLDTLYTQASLTVFFSSYEGFGFPVLESLVRGTPVLLSRGGSLGAFAYMGVGYTNPLDADAAAAHMHALLVGEKSEHMPEGVRERVAREYSWASTARKTYNVLLEAGQEA
jgi:glycosyltransferase involved in cell wall biosynthesis